MAVTSTRDYVGVPADVVSNYHGNQLVYVSWDHHLMFAAPFILCVSPDMPLGDLVHGPIAQLVQADPDAARIDWPRVEWFKRGRPFRPDFSRSLAENDIAHKDQLRFRTPGLNSLCGHGVS
ncbi:phenol hydroxylase subunit P4 [Methylibium petroleiphilum]